MTPDELHTSFDSHVGELPGSDTVRALRRSALDEFMGLGFPSRKTENWRYTSVAPILDGEFELFPLDRSVDEATTSGLLERAGIAESDASMLFIDGTLVADRTEQLRQHKDFELLALPDSLERHGLIASPTGLRDYPFAALNIAFARDGAHLRVASGVELDTPVHVIFANSSGEQRAVQPQLIVDLAPGAAATIVLHLLSEAKTANWVNLLMHVSLAQSSTLNIQKLQQYGDDTLHTELLSAVIDKDASLKSTSVDIGGRLVRNDVRMSLEAEGAHCDLAGLVIAGENQHIDNHVAVNHVASRSTSDQQYRSIVGARGRAVFNGKVVVHRNTAGISAMQSSDNLLLAGSGEVDTKPELEIYTDDVKCSHGATIGEIDESELFYLRARGIDEITAKGLLTLGFAERTLERLPSFGARAAIAAKFGLEVPRDEPWEPSL
jgi:Fe-S cluster assembly protein SufD